jgi:hypothetical protein
MLVRLVPQPSRMEVAVPQWLWFLVIYHMKAF